MIQTAAFRTQFYEQETLEINATSSPEFRMIQLARAEDWTKLNKTYKRNFNHRSCGLWGRTTYRMNVNDKSGGFLYLRKRNSEK